MAEAAIVLGGRYANRQAPWRTKATAAHAKRSKNLTRQKVSSSSPAIILERRYPRMMKPGIGILRSCFLGQPSEAGEGRHRASHGDRLSTRRDARTQANRRREPTASAASLAPPAVGMLGGCELRQPVRHRHVESEQPALVQEHAMAAVVAITLVRLARSKTVPGSTGGESGS